METLLAMFCFYMFVFFMLFGISAFLCEALKVIVQKLEERERENGRNH